LVWTIGGVFALVSDDKSAKFKGQVAELEQMLAATPKALSRKQLEQIHGFMNCAVQTCRSLIPHLNGLHMTIDGWRPGRNNEG